MSKSTAKKICCHILSTIRTTSYSQWFLQTWVNPFHFHLFKQLHNSIRFMKSYNLKLSVIDSFSIDVDLLWNSDTTLCELSTAIWRTLSRSSPNSRSATEFTRIRWNLGMWRGRRNESKRKMPTLVVSLGVADQKLYWFIAELGLFYDDFWVPTYFSKL